LTIFDVEILWVRNQEDSCLMGQDYNLSCLNISLCCSHENNSPPNPCECTIVCKTRASHASPGAAYMLSRFYPRPIFTFPQLDLNSYYVSGYYLRLYHWVLHLQDCSCTFLFGQKRMMFIFWRKLCHDQHFRTICSVPRFWMVIHFSFVQNWGFDFILANWLLMER
jgi:hypothetical protein